jgi:Phosphotransferase enzyme family
VEHEWERLSARAVALPPSPPELSVLAMMRSAALTIFLFGDGPRPLLVLKVPREGNLRIERELESLRLAEASGVAPRLLGRVGEAHVQEGIAGAPLRVEPLTPVDAASLAWTPELESVADGLARLGTATRREGPPQELGPTVERALNYAPLSGRARRTLAAAWRDVSRTESCALRHSDTSPQNCLLDDRTLSGIVDWELAEPRGTPGFDVWNLALSYLESGLGLTRWTQELVMEAFRASWPASPYWADARRAARTAALAGGASERELDAVEVCFFGSRIGNRLERPGWHPTSARTVADALEHVCAG